MGKIINLNGKWNFKAEGKKTNFIDIPSCWENIIEEKDFTGPCTFWREIYVTDLNSNIFDTPIRNKSNNEPDSKPDSKPDNKPDSKPDSKLAKLHKLDNKRYVLYFGAVSYYCTVYVNDLVIGSHEGIWDSFWFDVTEYLKEGKNEIRLDIWKPGYKEKDQFPLRQVLSGFTPDVACTFGGIWDDVKLIETDGIYIDAHWGGGSFEKGMITLGANLKNLMDKDMDVVLNWDIVDMEGKSVANFSSKAGIAALNSYEVEINKEIMNIIPWDIDNPYLYSYRLTVKCEAVEEYVSRRFGIRDIKVEGTQILLNGRPVYLRGILHWGYYDNVIIPNPCKDTIKEEISKIKAYGFNMIKHCLYLPREEYLETADEEGIILWIELPLWLPEVTPELSKRIEREYPRMLRQLSGYVSVVNLSLGCELDAAVDGSILEKMYYLAHSMGFPLVRDNSGSGECYDGLPIDFADYFDYHFYADIHNIENLMETFTPGWRNYRPWLYGEFCDSDTMRSFQRIRKGKGVNKLWWEQDNEKLNPMSRLKPDFRGGVHDVRMEKYEINQDFDIIYPLSINHAMLHRKMTIELTRAFPQICGYNITAIRDVPIATSGIFDDFMNPKFDHEIFRMFNSDIVLSPAWDLTRIWVNGDRVQNRERFNFFGGSYYGLHVIISNYSSKTVKNPTVMWELKYENEIVSSSKVCINKTFLCGEVSELIYIGIKLPEVDKPKTFQLNIEMEDGRNRAKNVWPVFIYPASVTIGNTIRVYDTNGIFSYMDRLYNLDMIYDDICNITDHEIIHDEITNCEASWNIMSCDKNTDSCDFLATTQLTPKIRKFVEEGGRVFFIQRGEGFLPVKRVAFWREGTIRCYPHNIMDGIDYTWLDDLRYFSLSTETAFDSFEFEKCGIKKVLPIIRRYDCREWDATDYMVEFTMGKGTVLATTLRFEGGMGKQPCFMNNNPFARYLFDRIYNYLVTRY